MWKARRTLGRIDFEGTDDGRRMTVEATADGDGLGSHAVSALLARVADKTGLTRAPSRHLAPPQKRAGSHDRGRVIHDLAVVLADSGDCLTDLGAVRDQAALFRRRRVGHDAFRLIDQIASDPEAIQRLRTGRARACKLGGAARARDDRSGRDAVDFTLRQGGRRADLETRLRLSPRVTYCDQTGETLVGELRRSGPLGKR